MKKEIKKKIVNRVFSIFVIMLFLGSLVNVDVVEAEGAREAFAEDPDQAIKDDPSGVAECCHEDLNGYQSALLIQQPGAKDADIQKLNKKQVVAAAQFLKGDKAKYMSRFSPKQIDELGDQLKNLDRTQRAALTSSQLAQGDVLRNMGARLHECRPTAVARALIARHPGISSSIAEPGGFLVQPGAELEYREGYLVNPMFSCPSGQNCGINLEDLKGKTNLKSISAVKDRKGVNGFVVTFDPEGTLVAAGKGFQGVSVNEKGEFVYRDDKGRDVPLKEGQVIGLLDEAGNVHYVLIEDSRIEYRGVEVIAHGSERTQRTEIKTTSTGLIVAGPAELRSEEFVATNFQGELSISLNDDNRLRAFETLDGGRAHMTFRGADFDGNFKIDVLPERDKEYGENFRFVLNTENSWVEFPGHKRITNPNGRTAPQIVLKELTGRAIEILKIAIERTTIAEDLKAAREAENSEEFFELLDKEREARKKMMEDAIKGLTHGEREELVKALELPEDATDDRIGAALIEFYRGINDKRDDNKPIAPSEQEKLKKIETKTFGSIVTTGSRIATLDNYKAEFVPLGEKLSPDDFRERVENKLTDKYRKLGKLLERFENGYIVVPDQTAVQREIRDIETQLAKPDLSADERTRLTARKTALEKQTKPLDAKDYPQSEVFLRGKLQYGVKARGKKEEDGDYVQFYGAHEDTYSIYRPASREHSIFEQQISQLTKQLEDPELSVDQKYALRTRILALEEQRKNVAPRIYLESHTVVDADETFTLGGGTIKYDKTVLRDTDLKAIKVGDVTYQVSVKDGKASIGIIVDEELKQLKGGDYLAALAAVESQLESFQVPASYEFKVNRVGENTQILARARDVRAALDISASPVRVVSPTIAKGGVNYLDIERDAIVATERGTADLVGRKVSIVPETSDKWVAAKHVEEVVEGYQQTRALIGGRVTILEEIVDAKERKLRKEYNDKLKEGKLKLTKEEERAYRACGTDQACRNKVLNEVIEARVKADKRNEEILRLKGEIAKQKAIAPERVFEAPPEVGLKEAERLEAEKKEAETVAGQLGQTLLESVKGIESKDEQDAYKIIVKASDLEALGETEAAITELRNVKGKGTQEQQVSALKRIANIFISENNYAGAEKEFLAVLELDKHDFNAMQLLGQMLDAQGKGKQARDQYDIMIATVKELYKGNQEAIDKITAGALESKAESYAREGNNEEATKTYQERYNLIKKMYDGASEEDKKALEADLQSAAAKWVGSYISEKKITIDDFDDAVKSLGLSDVLSDSDRRAIRRMLKVQQLNAEIGRLGGDILKARQVEAKEINDALIEIEKQISETDPKDTEKLKELRAQKQAKIEELTALGERIEQLSRERTENLQELTRLEPENEVYFRELSNAMLGLNEFEGARRANDRAQDIVLERIEKAGYDVEKAGYLRVDYNNLVKTLNLEAAQIRLYQKDFIGVRDAAQFNLGYIDERHLPSAKYISQSYIAEGRERLIERVKSGELTMEEAQEREQELLKEYYDKAVNVWEELRTKAGTEDPYVNIESTKEIAGIKMLQGDSEGAKAEHFRILNQLKAGFPGSTEDIEDLKDIYEVSTKSEIFMINSIDIISKAQKGDLTVEVDGKEVEVTDYAGVGELIKEIDGLITQDDRFLKALYGDDEAKIKEMKDASKDVFLSTAREDALKRILGQLFRGNERAVGQMAEFIKKAEILSSDPSKAREYAIRQYQITEKAKEIESFEQVNDGWLIKTEQTLKAEIIRWGIDPEGKLTAENIKKLTTISSETIKEYEKASEERHRLRLEMNKLQLENQITLLAARRGRTAPGEALALLSDQEKYTKARLMNIEFILDPKTQTTGRLVVMQGLLNGLSPKFREDAQYASIIEDLSKAVESRVRTESRKEYYEVMGALSQEVKQAISDPGSTEVSVSNLEETKSNLEKLKEKADEKTREQIDELIKGIESTIENARKFNINAKTFADLSNRILEEEDSKTREFIKGHMKTRATEMRGFLDSQNKAYVSSIMVDPTLSYQEKIDKLKAFEAEWKTIGAENIVSSLDLAAKRQALDDEWWTSGAEYRQMDQNSGMAELDLARVTAAISAGTSVQEAINNLRLQQALTEHGATSFSDLPESVQKELRKETSGYKTDANSAFWNLLRSEAEKKENQDASDDESTMDTRIESILRSTYQERVITLGIQDRALELQMQGMSEEQARRQAVDDVAKGLNDDLQKVINDVETAHLSGLWGLFSGASDLQIKERAIADEAQTQLKNYANMRAAQTESAEERFRLLGLALSIDSMQRTRQEIDHEINSYRGWNAGFAEWAEAGYPTLLSGPSENSEWNQISNKIQADSNLRSQAMSAMMLVSGYIKRNREPLEKRLNSDIKELRDRRDAGELTSEQYESERKKLQEKYNTDLKGIETAAIERIRALDDEAGAGEGEGRLALLQMSGLVDKEGNIVSRENFKAGISTDIVADGQEGSYFGQRHWTSEIINAKSLTVDLAIMAASAGLGALAKAKYLKYASKLGWVEKTEKGYRTVRTASRLANAGRHLAHYGGGLLVETAAFTAGNNLGNYAVGNDKRYKGLEGFTTSLGMFGGMQLGGALTRKLASNLGVRLAGVGKGQAAAAQRALAGGQGLKHFTEAGVKAGIRRSLGSIAFKTTVLGGELATFTAFSYATDPREMSFSERLTRNAYSMLAIKARGAVTSAVKAGVRAFNNKFVKPGAVRRAQTRQRKAEEDLRRRLKAQGVTDNGVIEDIISTARSAGRGLTNPQGKPITMRDVEAKVRAAAPKGVPSRTLNALVGQAGTLTIKISEARKARTTKVVEGRMNKYRDAARRAGRTEFTADENLKLARSNLRDGRATKAIFDTRIAMGEKLNPTDVRTYEKNLKLMQRSEETILRSRLDKALKAGLTEDVLKIQSQMEAMQEQYKKNLEGVVESHKGVVDVDYYKAKKAEFRLFDSGKEADGFSSRIRELKAQIEQAQKDKAPAKRISELRQQLESASKSLRDAQVKGNNARLSLAEAQHGLGDITRRELNAERKMIDLRNRLAKGNYERAVAERKMVYDKTVEGTREYAEKSQRYRDAQQEVLNYQKAEGLINQREFLYAQQTLLDKKAMDLKRASEAAMEGESAGGAAKRQFSKLRAQIADSAAGVGYEATSQQRVAQLDKVHRQQMTKEMAKVIKATGRRYGDVGSDLVDIMAGAITEGVLRGDPIKGIDKAAIGRIVGNKLTALRGSRIDITDTEILSFIELAATGKASKQIITDLQNSQQYEKARQQREEIERQYKQLDNADQISKAVEDLVKAELRERAAKTDADRTAARNEANAQRKRLTELGVAEKDARTLRNRYKSDFDKTKGDAARARRNVEAQLERITGGRLTQLGVSKKTVDSTISKAGRDRNLNRVLTENVQDSDLKVRTVRVWKDGKGNVVGRYEELSGGRVRNVATGEVSRRADAFRKHTNAGHQVGESVKEFFLDTGRLNSEISRVGANSARGRQLAEAVKVFERVNEVWRGSESAKTLLSGLGAKGGDFKARGNHAKIILETLKGNSRIYECPAGCGKSSTIIPTSSKMSRAQGKAAMVVLANEGALNDFITEMAGSDVRRVSDFYGKNEGVLILERGRARVVKGGRVKEINLEKMSSTERASTLEKLFRENQVRITSKQVFFDLTSSQKLRSIVARNTELHADEVETTIRAGARYRTGGADRAVMASAEGRHVARMVEQWAKELGISQDRFDRHANRVANRMRRLEGHVGSDGIFEKSFRDKQMRLALARDLKAGVFGKAGSADRLKVESLLKKTGADFTRELNTLTTQEGVSSSLQSRLRLRGDILNKMASVIGKKTGTQFGLSRSGQIEMREGGPTGQKPSRMSDALALEYVGKMKLMVADFDPKTGRIGTTEYAGVRVNFNNVRVAEFGQDLSTEQFLIEFTQNGGKFYGYSATPGQAARLNKILYNIDSTMTADPGRVLFDNQARTVSVRQIGDTLDAVRNFDEVRDQRILTEFQGRLSKMKSRPPSDAQLKRYGLKLGREAYSKKGYARQRELAMERMAADQFARELKGRGVRGVTANGLRNGINSNNFVFATGVDPVTARSAALRGRFAGDAHIFISPEVGRAGARYELITSVGGKKITLNLGDTELISAMSRAKTTGSATYKGKVRDYRALIKLAAERTGLTLKNHEVEHIAGAKVKRYFLQGKDRGTDVLTYANERFTVVGDATTDMTSLLQAVGRSRGNDGKALVEGELFSDANVLISTGANKQGLSRAISSYKNSKVASERATGRAIERAFSQGKTLEGLRLLSNANEVRSTQKATTNGIEAFIDANVAVILGRLQTDAAARGVAGAEAQRLLQRAKWDYTERSGLDLRVESGRTDTVRHLENKFNTAQKFLRDLATGSRYQALRGTLSQSSLNDLRAAYGGVDRIRLQFSNRYDAKGNAIVEGGGMAVRARNLVELAGALQKNVHRSDLTHDTGRGHVPEAPMVSTAERMAQAQVVQQNLNVGAKNLLSRVGRASNIPDYTARATSVMDSITSYTDPAARITHIPSLIDQNFGELPQQYRTGLSNRLVAEYTTVAALESALGEEVGRPSFLTGISSNIDTNPDVLDDVIRNLDATPTALRGTHFDATRDHFAEIRGRIGVDVAPIVSVERITPTPRIAQSFSDEAGRLSNILDYDPAVSGQYFNRQDWHLQLPEAVARVENMRTSLDRLELPDRGYRNSLDEVARSVKALEGVDFADARVQRTLQEASRKVAEFRNTQLGAVAQIAREETDSRAIDDASVAVSEEASDAVRLAESRGEAVSIAADFGLEDAVQSAFARADHFDSVMGRLYQVDQAIAGAVARGEDTTQFERELEDIEEEVNAEDSDLLEPEFIDYADNANAEIERLRVALAPREPAVPAVAEATEFEELVDREYQAASDIQGELAVTTVTEENVAEIRDRLIQNAIRLRELRESLDLGEDYQPQLDDVIDELSVEVDATPEQVRESVAAAEEGLQNVMDFRLIQIRREAEQARIAAEREAAVVPVAPQVVPEAPAAPIQLSPEVSETEGYDNARFVIYGPLAAEATAKAMAVALAVALGDETAQQRLEASEDVNDFNQYIDAVKQRYNLEERPAEVTPPAEPSLSLDELVQKEWNDIKALSRDNLPRYVRSLQEQGFEVGEFAEGEHISTSQSKVWNSIKAAKAVTKDAQDQGIDRADYMQAMQELGATPVAEIEGEDVNYIIGGEVVSRQQASQDIAARAREPAPEAPVIPSEPAPALSPEEAASIEEIREKSPGEIRALTRDQVRALTRAQLDAYAARLRGLRQDVDLTEGEPIEASQDKVWSAILNSRVSEQQELTRENAERVLNLFELPRYSVARRNLESLIKAQGAQAVASIIFDLGTALDENGQPRFDSEGNVLGILKYINDYYSHDHGDILKRAFYDIMEGDVPSERLDLVSPVGTKGFQEIRPGESAEGLTAEYDRRKNEIPNRVAARARQIAVDEKGFSEEEAQKAFPDDSFTANIGLADTQISPQDNIQELADSLRFRTSAAMLEARRGSTTRNNIGRYDAELDNKIKDSIESGELGRMYDLYVLAYGHAVMQQYDDFNRVIEEFNQARERGDIDAMEGAEARIKDIATGIRQDSRFDARTGLPFFSDVVNMYEIPAKIAAYMAREGISVVVGKAFTGEEIAAADENTFVASDIDHAGEANQFTMQAEALFHRVRTNRQDLDVGAMNLGELMDARGIDGVAKEFGQLESTGIEHLNERRTAIERSNDILSYVSPQVAEDMIKEMGFEEFKRQFEQAVADNKVQNTPQGMVDFILSLAPSSLVRHITITAAAVNKEVVDAGLSDKAREEFNAKVREGQTLDSVLRNTIKDLADEIVSRVGKEMAGRNAVLNVVKADFETANEAEFVIEYHNSETEPGKPRRIVVRRNAEGEYELMHAATIKEMAMQLVKDLKSQADIDEINSEIEGEHIAPEDSITEVVRKLRDNVREIFRKRGEAC